MSDGNLIPFGDEQAKLGQETVKALAGAARYFADVIGDLPKDLVGLLVGDRVKAARHKRIAKLWDDTKDHLQQQGVAEPEAPNPKLAFPILAAAADETSDELQALWARLLAASMNPARSNSVRIRFAEAVKRLDPLDARLLEYLRKNGGTVPGNKQQDVANIMSVSLDEFMVSFENLVEVGFAKQYNTTTSGLMPLGREFLRVVAD
jgi:hypothetical protein